MRKTHLGQCAPEWHVGDDGVRRSISFDCPEADGGCKGRHRIPINRLPGPGASCWGAAGELPNVTITPSIRCGGACQMHININGGCIDFCDDSKSGPDWSRRES